jgi:hypothetical protein
VKAVADFQAMNSAIASSMMARLAASVGSVGAM